MRIVRVKVLHEGTFESLLSAALDVGACLHYRGRYYQRIAGGRSVAIYRLSSHGLVWIQDRVEDYESGFFQHLLSGRCGRDGIIRRHASVRRAVSGAYRPVQPRNATAF